MPYFKNIFITLFLLITIFKSEAINVILVFANSSKTPTSTRGAQFLNFKEVTKIEDRLATAPSDLRAHQRTPKCKQLLKTALDSLTGFCQNAFGMKTGTVNVYTKIVSGSGELQGFDKDYPQHQEYPMGQPKEYLNNEDLKKYPDYQEYHFDNPNKEYPKKGSFKKFREQTTLVPRQRKYRIISDANEGEVIIKPEHTEVFSIRRKREARMTEEPPEEFRQVPLEKPQNPNWDVLDIMSHVRFSFFGNLFNKNNKLPEESQEAVATLNRIKEDSGLFEAVVATFEELQVAGSEEFLLVIFGGNLLDIADGGTPLMQSIKHLVECTDPNKTLFVLTGNCPGNEDEEEIVVINRPVVNKCGSKKIPLFARGPQFGDMNQCKYLHDVPNIVRNILERNHNDRAGTVVPVTDKRPKQLKIDNKSNKTLHNKAYRTRYFAWLFIGLYLLIS